MAFVDIGVQLGQHPGRQLDKHAESKRHSTSAMRYSQFTSNINVYKQLQAQNQNEVTFVVFPDCLKYLTSFKVL